MERIKILLYDAVNGHHCVDDYSTLLSIKLTGSCNSVQVDDFGVIGREKGINVKQVTKFGGTKTAEDIVNQYDFLVWKPRTVDLVDLDTIHTKGENWYQRLHNVQPKKVLVVDTDTIVYVQTLESESLVFKPKTYSDVVIRNGPNVFVKNLTRIIQENIEKRE